MFRRRSPADTTQSGLCDIQVAAVDIAPPALPASPQLRPPKRRFTEIGDSEDEDPDSDELYGWFDDDEVAAEGLLIKDELPDGDTTPAEAQTNPAPHPPSE